MSDQGLRFRQIHLDFHTSEHIHDIGRDFDPAEFAETLSAAHVDSVTCFARCHHGYLYYPSALFPERIHPHLVRRDLLGEQIGACHERGIRVPVYITVQWDEFTANQHPEWLALAADGRVVGTAPFEAGFYRVLCVNSPYLDFLKAQTREVLESYPVDGIFFDIVGAREDCSKWSLQGMLEQGLDPSDRAARIAYAWQAIDAFKLDMTAFVRRYNRDCTIFYNAGHVGPRHRAALDAYTHLELESLPSGGWGYLHFSAADRYARTLDKDILGMTGKFHTSWGDFHSFKNRAALEYECFRMLALGAKCSVGDQLHPHGRICGDTYRLIGEVYGQVEAREPWCRGARAAADIGLFSVEEFENEAAGIRVPDAALGAVSMLEECACEFDIVDSRSDLSRYRVLVLPDAIPVDGDLAAALEGFVSAGGALIASHRSGLAPAGDAFALRALGVELVGDAPYSPDFLRPGPELADGLPGAELVMYRQGLQVKARDGADVLAEVAAPFFNRDWRHWCSHRHTPSSGSVAYPGIVRNGRAVYFAHPIFSQYRDNAPRWCKQLFRNVLDLLLPDPVVRVTGPSTLLVSVTDQPQARRRVVHLLHYVPQRRGNAFDTLEDVLPVRGVRISVAAPGAVKRVTTAPDQEELPFTVSGNRLEVEVPEIHGHTMVVLEKA